jgi:hypothetical protein
MNELIELNTNIIKVTVQELRREIINELRLKHNVLIIFLRSSFSFMHTGKLAVFVRLMKSLRFDTCLRCIEFPRLFLINR